MLAGGRFPSHVHQPFGDHQDPAADRGGERVNEGHGRLERYQGAGLQGAL